MHTFVYGGSNSAHDRIGRVKKQVFLMGFFFVVLYLSDLCKSVLFISSFLFNLHFVGV